MMEITRAEALRHVAATAVSNLSEADRRALLEEWWGVDWSATEQESFPEELRNEIASCSEPRGAVLDDRYVPLLVLAFVHGLYGVKNSWLEQEIGQTRDGAVKVVGSPELAEPCRCCGYRTIRERGNYEICPVCFWEDDGAEVADRVSGVNRMTLEEGRHNFATFGACAPEMLPHVLSDGPERYERDPARE